MDAARKRSSRWWLTKVCGWFNELRMYLQDQSLEPHAFHAPCTNADGGTREEQLLRSPPDRAGDWEALPPEFADLPEPGASSCWTLTGANMYDFSFALRSLPPIHRSLNRRTQPVLNDGR